MLVSETPVVEMVVVGVVENRIQSQGVQPSIGFVLAVQ